MPLAFGHNAINPMGLGAESPRTPSIFCSFITKLNLTNVYATYAEPKHLRPPIGGGCFAKSLGDNQTPLVRPAFALAHGKTRQSGRKKLFWLAETRVIEIRRLDRHGYETCLCQSNQYVTIYRKQDRAGKITNHEEGQRFCWHGPLL